MTSAARVVEWVRTVLISAALAAALTAPLLVRSPAHPAQITSERCVTHEVVMQMGDQTIAIPRRTTCTSSNHRTDRR